MSLLAKVKLKLVGFNGRIDKWSSKCILRMAKSAMQVVKLMLQAQNRQLLR